MKKPVTVAITGAAGQIGSDLAMRIASGALFGLDWPVNLRLLEIPAVLPALSGVAMELEDCAFPTLNQIVMTDDLETAFGNADFVVLIGGKPRGPGMARKDLVAVNGPIYAEQGKMLDRVADRDVKVLVVGNPANTNCLLAMMNAPSLPSNSFSAMTRLDHNRLQSQIASKVGGSVAGIKRLVIWGNHSDTMFPDISRGTAYGAPLTNLLDKEYLEQVLIPTVQRRGAEIIKVRGKSSAASAAHAAVRHLRDWIYGTPENDWTSMAVRSNGMYDVPDDLIFSFPVSCEYVHGYEIDSGFQFSEDANARMNATIKELLEERDAIKHLLP